MKLLYFAWMRERIGTGEEDLELPETIVTIADLIEWLKTRDETYAEAFRFPEMVRASINDEVVTPDTPIEGAREIGFFPPMTGG